MLTVTPKKTTSAYLAGLDNLRALAALFVCCRHFAGLLPERERIDFLREIMAYGPMGVYSFFVVSGYIVPYSLLRKNYQLPQFGRYLWRRFVRLGPAFYIATLLTLLQWVIIDKFVHQGPAYQRGLSLGRLAHNALFTVPLTGYDWVIGAAWPLAIEWQYYVTMGLLLPLLFVHRHASWFFLLFYGLLGLWGLVANAGLNMPTFSALFAMGGITLLWQRGQLSWVWYGASMLAFTAVTVYCVNPLAAGVGLVAVPALLLAKRAIPGLGAIGKMAYSVVLTHMLAGRTAEYLLYRLIVPTTDAGRLVVLAGCLGAALGVAALFYRWVERPFSRLAAQQH